MTPPTPPTAPQTVARRHRGPQALPQQTACVVGAFDGLHRGHQALIDRARGMGQHLALVTFDPHPARILAPAKAPALLQTDTQRLRVAGHLGIERVVLLPFDRAMASMAPETFAHTILRDGLQPAAVVVGSDFRFGRDRAGTHDDLRRCLPGIEVAVVDPVPEGAADDAEAATPKLGSTQIRQAIAAGELGRAAAMLGRHYAVAGTVEVGDRRGRTIGFPTANLAADNELLPPPGVYATVVTVWSPEAPDFGAVWPAVTNLGYSPTFKEDGSPLRLESHVLDHDLQERLYGLAIEVAFVARVRGEQRFDGIDALRTQIARDVEAARTHLTPAALSGALAPLPPPAR